MTLNEYKNKALKDIKFAIAYIEILEKENSRLLRIIRRGNKDGKRIN